MQTVKIKYKNIQNLVLWVMSFGRYPDTALMFLNIIIHPSRVRLVVVKWLVILVLSSFVIITWNGYPYGKYLQQSVLLVVNILGYDIFFRKYVKDVRMLFLRYVSFTYILALVAIAQLLVYLAVDRDVFYVFISGVESYRVHAWLTEPGWYAAFITPAVAYTFYNRQYARRHYKKSILLIASYLCSFSALAYFALMLMAMQWLYVRLSKKIKLIALCCFAAVFFCIYTYQSKAEFSDTEASNPISAIIMKVSQTFSVFNSFDPSAFELLNISSYATLTNFWVAVNAPTRLIGTGLGTHEISYEMLYKSNYEYYGLNKEDAYSLFTRIFSEFGFVGVLLLFLFLKKNYNQDNYINKAVLIYIVSMGIRGGLYTMYGIIMFVYIYYLTSKKQEKKLYHNGRNRNNNNNSYIQCRRNSRPMPK